MSHRTVTAIVPMLLLCLLAGPLPAADQGRMYTPDQVARISAGQLMQYMAQAQPGYWQFAALNALTEKTKRATGAERDALLKLVTQTMLDPRRGVSQRFQCCYVLSGCGDPRGVAPLKQVLAKDADSTMRSVAAEALGQIGTPECKEALLAAARTETDPRVRQALQKLLGAAMPTAQPKPAGGAAATAAVLERAPNGPPKPPAAPALPRPGKLPWPFPGSLQDQSIFNNYQQATDIYIHCGLDFIKPAGTPVLAVEAGQVAAITTNYPQWKTHHFFIITPQPGGSEGWCYTHVDPDTFTFKQGGIVKQGEKLGSLVDFSVGDRPGVAHLHLQGRAWPVLLGDQIH